MGWEVKGIPFSCFFFFCEIKNKNITKILAAKVALIFMLSLSLNFWFAILTIDLPPKEPA